MDEDDLPEGGQIVEFRLTYRGRLPAASQGNLRNKDKHSIRKHIHKQLRELWQTQRPLTEWMTQKVAAQNSPTGQEITVVEAIGTQYARWGYRFVPLITEGRSLACELDVLFLRRDSPGRIIGSGGDIDNRLKVLFDGLRMPKYEQEIIKFPAGADEDPFFVLLEDDSLINKISITTDRLLTPLEDEESANDVHLVITVRTKVLNVNKVRAAMEFLL